MHRFTGVGSQRVRRGETTVCVPLPVPCMAISIDPNDASPTLAARACVYVAACAGEDLAKVGFSRDPLDRLRELHRRWFDFFDLDAGFLVAMDSVAEARRIERRLIRLAVEHRAPAPLTRRVAAGGHTEWFRGAVAPLHAAAGKLESEGFAVVAPLRVALLGRVRQRAGDLYEWSLQALPAIAAGDADVRATLRDALDEAAAFGLAPALDDEAWRALG
jgi:hypothetical protein